MVEASNGPSAPSSAGGLKVKAFGVDLAATGTLVIVLLAIAALAAIVVWRDYARGLKIDALMASIHAENESVRHTVAEENQRVRDIVWYLDCRVQVNMFIAQRPRGEPVEWNAMPEYLYKCLPDFLSKKR